MPAHSNRMSRFVARLYRILSRSPNTALRDPLACLEYSGSPIARMRKRLVLEELEPRWLPSVSQAAFVTAPQTLTTAGNAHNLTASSGTLTSVTTCANFS